MEKEVTYVIYTDASFDDFTKIGNYAVIIMQGNKVLKRTAFLHLMAKIFFKYM